MKRRMMTGLAVLLTVLVLLLAPAAAIGERVHTDLTGYEETPLTISTPATGDFKAKIENDGTLVSWELSYRDTLSAVTQAHIHFGAPAISGGIVVFLCTNLGNAPVGAQLCPAAPATITGTFTAADVVSVGTAGAQGIAPGELAEVLRAIRAGAAYVNVHTVGFTGGEIRGQLDRGHDDH
jgi:CHRD domain